MVLVLIASITIFLLQPARAQTHILDIKIYYVSQSQRINKALERKAKKIFRTVEWQVNSDMLKKNGGLKFRFSLEALKPHNTLVSFHETPSEAIVFESLIDYLKPSCSQKPFRLYVFLIPNNLVVRRCTESAMAEQEHCVFISALGAADRDDGLGCVMAISKAVTSTPEELIATFFHELGHIIGLPDETGEICLNMPSYIMCEVTVENQRTPTFTKRYSEAVRALWLLQARPDNSQK